jgi:hypothetical protein
VRAETAGAASDLAMDKALGWYSGRMNRCTREFILPLFSASVEIDRS